MANINDIYLDGTRYSPVSEGIDELTVTYQEKDNIIGYGISSPIQFTEGAYNYLYGVFFANSCEGKDNTVDVQVVLRNCCADCAPTTLNFILDFEGVTLCELDCIIIGELKAQNDCQKNYEYLRDTVFWDDGFAEDVTQEKTWYCKQIDSFFLYRQLFNFIFVISLVLEVFETLFQGLIQALLWLDDLINVLTATQKAILEQWKESGILSFDDYLAFLTGCGQWHFSSYYKSILDYNISKANDFGGCELTLNAPFLDTLPYSELAIFQSQDKKGITCQNKDQYHPQQFKDRAYNRTTLQLIREIAQVFNHRAVILPNGTLTIDTYENIVNGTISIVNAENEFYQEKGKIPAPCYSYEVGKYCASSVYSYQKDSRDEEGNRRLRSGELNTQLISSAYYDAVIWDEDGAGNADQVCEKTFPFGAVRGMFDMETAIKDGLFDSDKAVDDLRTGKVWFVSFPDWLVSFASGSACLPRESDVILENHTTEVPKLLILQGNDQNDNGMVWQWSLANGSDDQYKIYNRPMHLDYESNIPELIQQFHETDDPNHPDHRLMVLEDFEFSMNCDRLNNINQYGTYVGITTRYGKGMPKQITLDFNNCRIIASGVTLKCG